MAWFRHHYHCESCSGSWLAEAAAVVESDCRFCGARDVAPYKSDDRTVIVERRGAEFVVLACAETAVSTPEDTPLGRFASRDEALAFAKSRKPVRLNKPVRVKQEVRGAGRPQPRARAEAPPARKRA